MKIGIKGELQKIVELQKIDSRIFDLTHQKDNVLPSSLKQLQDSLEEKRQEFHVREEEFKKVQLKKKDCELDLATKEEALRKAQSQLYQLKTNKEYQAKLSEISSIKADISLAEEEVLKTLEEIEIAKHNLETQAETLKQAETQQNSECARIQNQIRDIEAQIANLASKRERFAKQIDQPLLSRYERLLKTREGLAIAPVTGTSCGACYMRVPHQKINLIKMYSDLVFCESCVRILYIPEDIDG